MSKKAKLIPSLWYAKDVEAAVRFYTSVFPDSRIDETWKLPVESPSGPPGSVVIINFTLFGQWMQAMEAGPHHDFNDSISFTVNCDTQAELDKYWNAILEKGGKPQACGWIIDAWGVRWQIVPKALEELMASSDKNVAKRVAEEMMRQVKFDISKLQAAASGK